MVSSSLANDVTPFRLNITKGQKKENFLPKNKRSLLEIGYHIAHCKYLSNILLNKHLFIYHEIFLPHTYQLL